MYKDAIHLVAMHNPRMFVMRMVCRKWNEWLHDEIFIGKWLAKYKTIKKNLVLLGGIPYKGFVMQQKDSTFDITQFKNGKVKDAFIVRVIRLHRIIQVHKKLDNEYWYVECLKLYGNNFTTIASEIRNTDNTRKYKILADNTVFMAENDPKVLNLLGIKNLKIPREVHDLIKDPVSELVRGFY
jgi:hypothetical protein